MARRGKGRSLAELRRRAGDRAVAKKYLVVCEGPLTEKAYFDDLRGHLRNPLVKVKIKGRGKDPLSLVNHAAQLAQAQKKRARKRGDPYGAYDEVWCVVDTDDHASLEEALAHSRRVQISTVVSNPCFEVWAVLHLREVTAPTTAASLRKELGQQMPEYSRRKLLDFSVLAPGIECAIHRARALDGGGGRVNVAGPNPSTAVHNLVAALLPQQRGRARR